MAKEESALPNEERDHICDPDIVETFKMHGTGPVEFPARALRLDGLHLL
jgi:hypothetical protein